MVNAAVYEKLVQVAKARTTITYTALASVADITLAGSGDDEMKTLGFVLDEIADQEIAAGRPLLPAVVVKKSDNMPGAGLFIYARKKGLQKKKTDNLTFFAEELKRVYAYWSSNSP